MSDEPENIILRYLCRLDERTELKPALVAVALALTLALPLPALAAECSEWNTRKFFETATVADVEKCLTAGADVNARAIFGFTPLHHAAGNSTPAVVQALIDAGADIEARAILGVTPLHWAALSSKSTPAVVQTLIDAGADMTTTTKYGQTPFDLIPDDSPLVGTKVYWLLKKG